MPSSPAPIGNELDTLARAVLRQFPAAIPNGELLFLHNHGGFSGACLWRVESRDSWLCLRAWPPSVSFADYLTNTHGLMRQARAAGLSFVPSVQRSICNETYVQHVGRLWDLTQWMPGQADFHSAPSPHCLAQACEALGQLHNS